MCNTHMDSMLVAKVGGEAERLVIVEVRVALMELSCPVGRFKIRSRPLPGPAGN